MSRDQKVDSPPDAREAAADKYARGMAACEGVEAESTPELDRFQFGLFERFLGRRILEVGAGGGRFTAQVLEARPDAEFVVVEPSPYFFAMLSRRFHGRDTMTLIRSEIGAVAAQYAGHFDCVFAVDVLEHIEDDRAFLEKSLECVAPGGRVIILVPAFQFLYSRLDENIGHYRRYDRGMIRRLLAGLDAQIEALFYSNLLGFFGSLYYSKIRRIHYQGGDRNKHGFLKVYRAFSKHVVPVVSAMERRVRPPFGLNLTLILRKPV